MQRTGLFTSAIALTAGMGWGASALAQTTTQVEEIVVVGARLESERAVQAKREITVVSDSVTADEVGSLPDYGLGEALDRVPGVTTMQNNGRGEAQFITIRGLNADYNLVQVDGVALPTTEPSRRNVSLDIIPSSIAQRVEVYKSRNPDMDGNAIGGIVNLRTRSAFDRPGAFVSGRANIGWYENERHYQDSTPSGQAELNLSNRFGSEDQFGVVVAAGYFRRDSSTLLSAIDNYLFFDDAGARLSNANAGDYAVAAANRRRWYTYDNLRQRYGGLVKLEYAGSNLEANFTYGDFRHKNDEQRQSNSLYINGNPTNITPTSGSVARARAQVDLAEYYEDRRISYYDANLIWRPADRSEVRLGLNHAVSTYKKDSYLETYRADILDTLSYRYHQADRNTFPSFYLNNVTAYFNEANYLFVERGPTYDENEEEAFAATLDYRYNLDRDARGLGFAVGAKARRLDRHFDFVRDIYHPASGSGVTLSGLTLAHRLYPGNGNGDYIMAIDRAAAEAAFAANPSNYVLASNHIQANLSSDYELEEDVTAGYVLVRYQGDRFDVTAGGRYEDTRLDTGSNILRNGVWGWETQSQSYDDFLPSISANYDVTDTLRIRLGASQSVGRPNYDLLAARFTITEGAASRTITGGNPELRPRRSNNFDLSAEYYFAPGALFAVGLFRREISDEIIRVVSTTVEDVGGEDFTVRVSQPINVSEVTINGIEFSLSVPTLDIVHQALENFGFAANLTLLDDEPNEIQMDNGTMRQLRGLMEGSDRFANLRGFYRLGRFSAELAYNYKSARLIQISTSAPVLDRSLDASHTIDAQLRYAIAPRIALTLQGKNITNNRPTRMTGPEQELIREQIDNGTSYFLGVNFQF